MEGKGSELGVGPPLSVKALPKKLRVFSLDTEAERRAQGFVEQGLKLSGGYAAHPTTISTIGWTLFRRVSRRVTVQVAEAPSASRGVIHAAWPRSM